MTVLEIAMLENQTIKEVRAARQKISEQHGHDLVRLVDHYKKLQREKLAALEGLSRLEDRAARGRMVDIDRILAKVPAAEPLPGDELPR